MDTVKQTLKNLLPVVIEGAIVISVVLFLRLSGILNAYMVSGHSMEPNYHSGNLVITSNLPQYEQYDVVTAFTPEHTPVIKRLIGMPGDTIKVENDHVYVNGELADESFLNHDESYELQEFSGEYTLAENEYFLCGDNRNGSLDSRYYGPVTKDMIMGKQLFKIGK